MPVEKLADGMAAVDASGSQCPECGLLQDPADTCSSCKADTGEAKSPFHGYRFHDLPDQAITELAESKASDQTIMGIADMF